MSATAGRGFRFTTLEGEVRSVGEHQAEGELPLLSVTLAPERQATAEMTVLLGPVEACREIGLVVEEGDRVRVRVFVAEEGEPVKAQKILNLSRSVMVRLRTMRDIRCGTPPGPGRAGPGANTTAATTEPARAAPADLDGAPGAANPDRRRKVTFRSYAASHKR